MLSDDDRLVHIYTPLKQALVELKRRREDPELQKKVAEFFGPHMFEPMMGEPKLVYARHIVSPNYEFEKLWGQIKDIPMKILFFESSTEFVPKNKEKYFLGKLYFFKKKLNKTPINTKCIIDFTPNYGKLMHTINCYNGERFIEIHHKALENKYKEINNKCDYVDYMSWLLKVRDLKKYHYIYTFALFICNGIFFENYDLLDPEENKLMIKQIFPSFEWVEKHFGIKPLIVPIVPKNLSSENYWFWYKFDIMKKYGISS